MFQVSTASAYTRNAPRIPQCNIDPVFPRVPTPSQIPYSDGPVGINPVMTKAKIADIRRGPLRSKAIEVKLGQTIIAIDCQNYRDDKELAFSTIKQIEESQVGD